MITEQQLQRVFTPTEYYEHGQALLSDDVDYYTNFLTWMRDNNATLKLQYMKLIAEEDKDALDTPYVEWAMTSYVITDYNKIKQEIEEMTGE